MTDKTKTSTRQATRAEAAGKAAFGGAAISYGDCTTAAARRQVVSELLGTGEGNGKTLKQLREILNGDPRAIRQQIERERRHVPILSGRNGYWLAGSEDEINTFCRSMRHRARQIWQTAANVEKAAGLNRHEPLAGQFDFWGGDDGA